MLRYFNGLFHTQAVSKCLYTLILSSARLRFNIGLKYFFVFFLFLLWFDRLGNLPADKQLTNCFEPPQKQTAIVWIHLNYLKPSSPLSPTPPTQKPIIYDTPFRGSIRLVPPCYNLLCLGDYGLEHSSTLIT